MTLILLSQGLCSKRFADTSPQYAKRWDFVSCPLAGERDTFANIGLAIANTLPYPHAFSQVSWCLLGSLSSSSGGLQPTPALWDLSQALKSTIF